MSLQVNEQIKLELLDEKHAEPLLRLAEENKEYLARWLSWVGHLKTVSDFQKFIIQSRRRCAEGLEFPYVIVVNKVVVGRIGLYEIDQQNKTASIGYWIGEQYQGQGIVTKSCQQLLKYAFISLNLNRLEIRCGTGNIKSRAIPEALNFAREGVLRQAESIKGAFIDLYLYALLRSDWKS